MTDQPKYVYFFTRQDLSPEQQLVQTAHVAYTAGYNLCNEHRDSMVLPPLNEQPEQTYFTVVGVRNEEALMAVQTILEQFDFEYSSFTEPDIGNQITSIATRPIPADQRGPLLAFNLLRIGK